MKKLTGLQRTALMVGTIFVASCAPNQLDDVTLDQAGPAQNPPIDFAKVPHPRHSSYTYADGTINYDYLQEDFGNPNENIILNPRAFNVGTVAARRFVQSPTADRLVFTDSGRAAWVLTKVKAGDTLYCDSASCGKSFLRNVVGIHQEGGNIVVDTTMAAITDVVWAGWIRAGHHKPNLVSINTGDKTFNIVNQDFNKSIPFGGGDLSGQVGFTSNLTINGDINVAVDFNVTSPHVVVNLFSVGLTGTATFTPNVSLDASASADKTSDTITLGQLSGPTIPIFTGVEVQPKLTATVVAEAAISGKIHFEAHDTLTYTVNASVVDDHGSWSHPSGQNFNDSGPIYTFSASAEAHAEARVQIQIALLVESVVGPTFTLSPTVGLEGSVSTQFDNCPAPHQSLKPYCSSFSSSRDGYFSLDANFGGDLTILGHDLGQLNSSPFTIIGKTLFAQGDLGSTVAQTLCPPNGAALTGDAITQYCGGGSSSSSTGKSSGSTGKSTGSTGKSTGSTGKSTGSKGSTGGESGRDGGEGTTGCQASTGQASGGEANTTGGGSDDFDEGSGSANGGCNGSGSNTSNSPATCSNGSGGGSDDFDQGSGTAGESTCGQGSGSANSGSGTCSGSGGGSDDFDEGSGTGGQSSCGGSGAVCTGCGEDSDCASGLKCVEGVCNIQGNCNDDACNGLSCLSDGSACDCSGGGGSGSGGSGSGSGRGSGSGSSNQGSGSSNQGSGSSNQGSGSSNQGSGSSNEGSGSASSNQGSGSSNEGSGSASSNQGSGSSNEGSGSASSNQGSGSSNEGSGSAGSSNQGSGSSNQGSGSGGSNQGSGSGGSNQGSGSGGSNQGSGSGGSNQGSGSGGSNQGSGSGGSNQGSGSGGSNQGSGSGGSNQGSGSGGSNQGSGSGGSNDGSGSGGGDGSGGSGGGSSTGGSGGGSATGGGSGGGSATGGGSGGGSSTGGGSGGGTGGGSGGGTGGSNGSGSGGS